MALLAAGVVAVGAAGWWWAHPDTFSQTGYGVGWDPAPPRAMAMSIASSYGERGSFTVVDVRPRITMNTQGARVEAVVCRGDGTHNFMSGGVVEAKDLGTYCLSTEPAAGARLLPEPGGLVGDSLVLVITPAKEGELHMDGVDLTFWHGWRRGTEHLDIEVRSPWPTDS